MELKENTLLGVLKTLFRWRRPIIIVCGIAAVGTAVISLLLPNYYRASTTFLVASPDQAKPELLFGQGNFEPEYYGNDDDIDRVLTIANSSELAQFVIDSFHLYRHYDIDSTTRKAAYRVRMAFHKHFEIKKTKLSALELSIEDTDKEMSAKMTKAARDKINQINQGLLKAGQNKIIKTYEAEIIQKENQLKQVGDSLISLRRKFGIYNIVAQTESMPAQLSEAEADLVSNTTRLEVLRQSPRTPRDTIANLEAKVKGMEQEVKSLDEKIKLFNDGMPVVLAYEKQYSEANQSLSDDRERLKFYKATYVSEVPSLLLVEDAETPIVKSRPKRSIIVIAAGAIAFLFSILGILLFESYKDLDWRGIYRPE